jgi:magnesium-transporting ATPase (P-type)
LSPELYKSGINSVSFNQIIFWRWIITAILESLFITYFPQLILQNSNPENGLYESFWDSGALTLTSVIVIVNFKMILFQKRWHIFHIIIIFLSILSWFAVAYICSSVTFIDYEWYHVSSTSY